MDKYTDYINEHISNVKMIWEEIQKSGLINMDEVDRFKCSDAISKHDESKFSVNEFEGYKQFFFPEKDDKKNKEWFDIAWNNHQKSNPHHWQYWILYKKGGSIALEMPFEYIVEMLCDWAAMSYKFKNSITEWYSKEQDNMLLHFRTTDCIERLIVKFEKVLVDLKEL